VTGSRKAYTNGHDTTIQFIKNRYDDFHEVVITDPESQRIYNDIQTKLNNIKNNLTNAFNEIHELDKIWQNESMI
jgi:hypothetical protein